MNKQQFDALPDEVRKLVEEGYRDGYAAAVDTVSSCVQRIGDSEVDKLFIHNRDSIAYMLRSALK